jgi:hypothetical protein
MKRQRDFTPKDIRLPRKAAFFGPKKGLKMA